MALQSIGFSKRPSLNNITFVTGAISPTLPRTISGVVSGVYPTAQRAFDSQRYVRCREKSHSCIILTRLQPKHRQADCITTDPHLHRHLDELFTKSCPSPSTIVTVLQATCLRIGKSLQPHILSSRLEPSRNQAYHTTSTFMTYF